MLVLQIKASPEHALELIKDSYKINMIRKSTQNSTYALLLAQIQF